MLVCSGEEGVVYDICVAAALDVDRRTWVLRLVRSENVVEIAARGAGVGCAVEGCTSAFGEEEGVDLRVWEGSACRSWERSSGKVRKGDVACFGEHEEFAGGDDAVHVSDAA